MQLDAAAHPTLAVSLLSQVQGCSLCCRERQEKQSEEVSCPWGVSDLLPQMPGSGWVSLQRVLLCLCSFCLQGSLQSLPPDQGSPTGSLETFHPVLLCLEKSKLTGERAGQRATNHNSFLVAFRPRNGLFIADACWQRGDLVRQGVFDVRKHLP